MNGAKWNVEFTTTNNNRYCWEGAFENKGFSPANNIFGPDDGGGKEKLRLFMDSGLVEEDDSAVAP